MIVRYGLVAIFLGSAAEGEPFALAGGVLAHRGLVYPWGAALAAFAGALAIDQTWFFLARRARSNQWVRSVSRRPAFAKSLDLLDRHPRWFVVLFRFAYGLRSVAPVAIGLSRVRTRQFLSFNIAAAAVWSILFTGVGYLAGPLFSPVSDRFGSGVGIAAAIISVGAIAFSLRRGSSESVALAENRAP